MGTEHSKKKIPVNYACAQCGETNFKLWLKTEKGVFILECASCYIDNIARESIGHNVLARIPAIPHDNGGFYDEEPPKEIFDWWKALPINFLIKKNEPSPRFVEKFPKKIVLPDWRKWDISNKKCRNESEKEWAEILAIHKKFLHKGGDEQEGKKVLAQSVYLRT